MEKNPLVKHESWGKNGHHRTASSHRDSNSGSDDHHRCDQDSTESLFDQERVSEDVDRFIAVLSAIDDKSSGIDQIPDFIASFSNIVESRIARYCSADSNGRFGRRPEEDALFIDSVRRISKLTNALGEFSSDSNVSASLNQTSVALQKAMAFLEEEFRLLMEDSRNDSEHENSHNVRKLASFSMKNHAEHAPDRCLIQREAPCGESNDYPVVYSPDCVDLMREIARVMITAGYEAECCQVYYISRRNSIRHRMSIEVEMTLNMDDVAKMPWESLEVEISRWINAVKSFSEIVLPAEIRLSESIFADYPQVRRGLLNNLFRLVVIQLLDFVEATAMAKRSAEKLFKYLDMYETLQNLIQSISGEWSSDELIGEVSAAAERIGESAASIFCDLENSIKSDAARTPVPGGAVHPLTRYVMNYLKYACEYRDALEKIFSKKSETENQHISTPKNLTSQELDRESESPRNFDTVEQTTPFSVQVVTVMDLLDANLEKKSNLYRDPSLHHIFLMNNGRYILQKVKGSTEIWQVMGDTWCRRRSSVVRQYHKNYQRETWNRVLQCLNHDGLLVNGKINKPLLKERFKIFTTTFEEIHRTQGSWVVSDEQLQSELRISISSVLIPAYRAFVGRFRQYLDSSKQVDKYIKYQPEDIETLIEGLFEGNTASMGRRRTA